MQGLKVSPVVAAEHVGHGGGYEAWHFSFDDFGGLSDPMLSLDHFMMRQPTFSPHPHAGFSAVTYLFPDSETGLLNRDSQGHDQIIEPGAMHWTLAGKGIMHDETPIDAGRLAHGLQLFVNLPARLKHAQPEGRHIGACDIPVLERPDGTKVRVVAGAVDGRESPFVPPADFTLVDLHLPQASAWHFDLPAGRSAVIYAVCGHVRAAHGGGVAPIGARHAVALRAGGRRESVMLETQTGSHFVLLCGEPLGEPIVVSGPFIMNTAQEAEQAGADYAAGRMGTLTASN